MKYELQSQHDEPVGIVISGGPRVTKAPAFRAYVWAPAPEDESETASTAA